MIESQLRNANSGGTTQSSPGSTAIRGALSDAAIRETIEAHRPGRGAKLPADFNARVGATHVAGKYHFTEDPFLIEGAERLLELGTRLGKFWFMPAGASRDYPFNSAWTKTKTFVELAESAYFEQLFAMPFETFVLEAHTPKENGHWKQDQPQSYYDEITREFYELTAHFYKRLRSRSVTVILQHWEGDWLLRGRGGEKWNPPPDNWRKLCEQMAKWLAARQAGVTKARAAHGTKAKCRVAHAAEVNRVLDGWKGIPTMTTEVLPQVELDLVSYSYYDAMSDPVTLWKAIEEIRRHARTGSLFGERSVFLGEVGIPENEQGNRLKERWDEFVGVLLAMNIPWFIHWELYCNELNPKLKPAPRPPVRNNSDVRGFFLVKPDGALSVAGEYFSGLWNKARRLRQP